MSRTSKALKRLGVAGVAVATIGAGVPAFFAVGASAAVTQPTGITLSPDSDTAAIGTCNAFTAQVTPAPGTGNSAVIDVTISQTGASTALAPAPTIGFCNPGNAANGGGTNPEPAAGNNGSPAMPVAAGTNTATQAGGNGTGGDITCSNTATGNGSTGVTTSCNAEFVTDANGTVTFGVFSNTTGNMTVDAYLDQSQQVGNNNNNVHNIGEPGDTSTKTWVANTVPSSGLTCTPQATTQPVGQDATYTCTAKTAGGQTAAGQTVKWLVTAGPDINKTDVCGTAGTGTNPAGNSGGTNNVGQTQCTVPGTNAEPGTDTIVFYIDTLNGAANNGPQAGEPQDTVKSIFTGAARNIACAPKTATPTSGSSDVTTCTVTDVNGLAVQGQTVAFTESGPGRIVAPTAQNNGGTSLNGAAIAISDANGIVDVVNQTTSTETGTETVTAQFAYNCGAAFGGYVACQTAAETGTPQECQQPAGSTVNSGNAVVTAPSGSATKAGNCSDTVQKIWVAGSQSPSPSPSATSTATTPPAGRQALTLTVNTPVINAGTQGRMTVSGTAGQSIQLVCYTRPSTTYTVARNATIDSAGSPVTFTLALGMNTRCFAQYATNSASGASASNVINVRTVVSIFPVRKSFRNYVFQGHNMPKYAGQLITLYYQSNAGTVRKGYVKTDSTGIYYIPVKFVGSGTFTFFVRTGQTLTNAAGESAHVSVNVH